MARAMIRFWVELLRPVRIPIDGRMQDLDLWSVLHSEYSTRDDAERGAHVVQEMVGGSVRVVRVATTVLATWPSPLSDPERHRREEHP